MHLSLCKDAEHHNIIAAVIGCNQQIIGTNQPGYWLIYEYPAADRKALMFSVGTPGGIAPPQESIIRVLSSTNSRAAFTLL